MGAPLLSIGRKRVGRKGVGGAKNDSGNGGGPCGACKPKRSMRLSISPDAEESESMQVTLAEGSPIQVEKKGENNENSDGGYSNAREGDCIYTVGSVDYLVKDTAPPSKSGGIDRVDERAALKDRSASRIDVGEGVAAEGGGSEKKKKKKLGGMFKKGGKKGGGNDGSEREASGDGNNDNAHDGDDQNGEKKDDAGGSKDDGNKDEEDGDEEPKKGPGGPTGFGPERLRFAAESTLPLHAGPESSAPAGRPSWTPVDGTEFKVRRGPNYPKNGRKENSSESLYEVFCVRYFRSGRRTVGGATRIMPLPEMGDSVGDDGGNTTGDAEEIASGGAGSGGKRHPELEGTRIPDVLVVHFMLPYEPPNMFKQKNDGPGGECVYYLRPSRRFLDEISGKIPQTPAATLFARWCGECESNFAMRSRFKCMALVRDIDRHNFGLLKSYNGKPVLITESGRACSGYHGDVRYLEMTANVHNWAFMAKKGFVSLIPKFSSMQMEVGFTIEAHADSEMPECMLGSTVLSYISENTGPMVAAEMQEPVHEHQS